MQILEHMQEQGYEQLLYSVDRTAGLKCLICIHDTTLGPALGGVRMWTYEKEEDAVQDALRLARAMTYKSSAAGLDLGGGKAVLIGNPWKDKSEALFKSLGRAVASLGGRYIATDDVGTTMKDLEYIRTQTPFVTGLPFHLGGSGDSTMPTAHGVLRAMEACAKEVWGKTDLKGKTVAIQGVGKVGANLAQLLHQAGAILTVADINKAAVKAIVKETGAAIVGPDEIASVKCDVFAPCALGGVINSRSIGRLQCQVVCGAANNQLENDSSGDEIRQRGVLYCPDYIANAGGVINLALELTGYDADVAYQKIEGIFETASEVISRSKRQRIATAKAADLMAEERVAGSKKLRSWYTQPCGH
ncbi:MAG: Glu/Leu/Phe/Val dehydrogenase [Chloroflexi bacterium]|nr:Glu/Leu/Phe/Val dehydrogenase [Chloroflexota bacterium]